LHGDVDKAIDHYTEVVPPLSGRSERLVLHSSCKQCRAAGSRGMRPARR
jgi:hypothetical protein